MSDIAMLSAARRCAAHARLLHALPLLAGLLFSAPAWSVQAASPLSLPSDSGLPGKGGPGYGSLVSTSPGFERLVSESLGSEGSQPTGPKQPWEEAVAAYRVGDYAAAAEWFRHDAERGHSRAQAVLGAMHAEGQGVAQDYGEAAKWYRLAVAQGEPMAQAGLAALYEFGRGVSADAEEATRLYLLAGKGGHAGAQARLGAMYFAGWGGVLQDDREALRWFSLAARQNHGRAQTYLGILYAQGRGVARDPVVAQVWFNLAATQGDRLGQLIGPKNAAELSIAEVALAATKAREWREAYAAARRLETVRPASGRDGAEIEAE